MRVAVAGGTGLVGTLVVAELDRAGHEPVVLSRSRGTDLTTGTGLAAALDGCAAVIDVSSVSTVSRKAAVEFFAQETDHLLAAGRQAGVSRLIVLSIVGVSEVGMGYYGGKRVQEERVAAGPLPWTILRATQFHEFPGQRMTGRSPVVPMPRFLCQPVAAAEVATALARLAERSPAGFATPIAGPERLHLVDMARQLVRARGERRLVLPLPVPGAVGKALANGALLPAGEYIEGKRTFAEYLAGRPGGGPPVNDGGTREQDLAASYTRCRARLIRVAYAIVGTHAEAEDVVSDCWLRLVAAEAREPVQDVEAWATVTVAHAALDVLRSARRRREAYVGPWLPEPVLGPQAGAGPDPAEQAAFHETVSFAVMVVLETLTPAERTAWALHELFGLPFTEIAEVVGRSPAAVRQLAVRARAHIAAGAPRVHVDPGQHQRTVDAFAAAAVGGDLAGLLRVLDPEIVLTSDSGGQVSAARRPVYGADKVARFLLGVITRIAPGQQIAAVTVNGGPGFAVTEDGRTVIVCALTVQNGLVRRVDLIMAPGKLSAQP